MRQPLILTFLFLSVTSILCAQQLDPKFDLERSPNSGPKFFNYGSVVKVLPLPDGKVIVIGEFHHVNGVRNSRIVRLNADGSIDNSFNTGLGTVGGDTPGAVTDVIRLSDGKLLLVGFFSLFNDVVVPQMVRLNTNGSVDNSFSPSGFISLPVWAADAQSTNKIVVAAGGRNLPLEKHVLRLTTAGQPDNTFPDRIITNSSGGGESITKIQTLADDKILVGGVFTNFGGQAGVNHLVRLNSDGSIDGTFSINTFDGVKDFVVLADAILVNHTNGIVTKYTLNGAPYSGFAVGTNIQGVETMAVMTDGSFVTSYKDKITKYSAAGVKLDEVDVGNGTTWVKKINDTKFLCGTINETTYSNVVARKLDLTIDNSWAPLKLLTLQTKNAFSKYPGDKFLVATDAVFYKQDNVNTLIKVNNVIRLKNDLTVDDTFAFSNFNEASPNSEVLDVNKDGKFYVRHNRMGGTYITRYNPNGTADGSFTEIAGFVYDGVEMTNGQFITGSSKIKRYNSNGSVDNGLDLTLNEVVTDYWCTSDGKLLAFSESADPNFGVKVGGTATQILFKIKTDGVLDDTFGSSVKFERVSDAEVLPDGKVLIAGKITKTVSGVVKKYPVMIIGADGTSTSTLDDSMLDKFGTGATLSGDRLYVAYVQGQEQKIGRFKLDGTIDTEFNPVVLGPGNEASYVTHQIFVCPDNTLLVTTGFDLDHIVFEEEPEPITGLFEEQGSLSLYPNPLKDHVNIRSEESILTYSLMTIDGRMAETSSPNSNEFSIDMTKYNNGMYVLRLKGEKMSKTLKLIKK